MKTQDLLVCLFGIVALTNVTYAEVNFGKKVPSADQVIDALSPAAATAPVTYAIKSRNLHRRRLSQLV